MWSIFGEQEQLCAAASNKSFEKPQPWGVTLGTSFKTQLWGTDVGNNFAEQVLGAVLEGNCFREYVYSIVILGHSLCGGALGISFGK